METQVTKTPKAAAVVERPTQPVDATASMFERLARDPSVDVAKIERLVQMQERAQARVAEAEFNTSLAAMQADLPVVGERGGIKDRAGNVQSTYALWEDVNRAILPHLKQHGFSLSFRQETTENGICVTGVLAHRGGHSERTSITLPADTSGSKNAVQSVGSSVSYGKRYTAGMLLNITSCGEDDDGGPVAPAGMTAEHQAAVKAKAEARGPEFLGRVLKSYKAAELSEIPDSETDSILARLESKAKAEAKA